MANSSSLQTTQAANKLPEQFLPSSNLSQEDIEDFLEERNLEIVSVLAPTLIYLVVLMVMGSVGNSVVFIVYYRRFKPSVIRTYILAMSLCDFLINVFAIPMHLVEIRFNATFYSSWGCKISRTIIIFLVILSAFILVAVSVTRQRIIRSLIPSSLYSVRTVYRAILICAAVSCVVAVPYGVLNGNHTLHFNGTNITGVECSISDEFYVSVFLQVYDGFLAISFVVCVIIMSVSYGRIMFHLRRHKKAAKVTISRETSDNVDPVSTSSHTENTKNIANAEHGTNKEHVHRNHFEVSESPKPEQPNVVLLVSKMALSTPHQLEPLEEENVRIEMKSTSSSAYGQENSHHYIQCDNSSTNPKIEETAVKLQQPMQTQYRQDDNTDVETHDAKERRYSSVSRQSEEIANGGTHDVPEIKSLSNSQQHKHIPFKTTSTRSISFGSDVPDNTFCAKERRPSTISQQSNQSAGRKRSINLGSEVQNIPSRTTLMLFVLTVVFVVNYLPYLVMEVLYQVFSEEEVADIDINLRYITLRSFYINSAINPLVYSFCSCRFRHECRQLFRCWKT
ncbi:muscarinic acetylcholine receptor gar-3-like [Littorina saxatilis]|uniref:G-protein coupled receptors family 1 profile domain-containing protein n=1 Tax=Littorina saxatilis TaxID=31220 RepID=A0AAN9AR11_9CAEN